MNTSSIKIAEHTKKEKRSSPIIKVYVKSIVSYGPDIKCYEVSEVNRNDLPSFEPGSHIDVHVPGGDLGVRQYSLCSDPKEKAYYRFAVQREAAGRGGSRAIFERVALNSEISISQPRNNFPLRTTARRHLLLSGGIGITPMISMIFELERQGKDYLIHHCARSPESTAFLDLLEPLVAKGRAFIHWDNGDPANGLNLSAALKEFEDGTHLYYCGPPGFMEAVSTASVHWPSDSVHREYFSPTVNPTNLNSLGSGNSEYGFGPPFQVKIASTGKVIDVPNDRSILSVLRDHGIEIEAQCELGVCGTCRTGYLAGDPDHRDFVLEADEQSCQMTLCCSRSKSPLLVLDL